MQLVVGTSSPSAPAAPSCTPRIPSEQENQAGLGLRYVQVVRYHFSNSPISCFQTQPIDLASTTSCCLHCTMVRKCNTIPHLVRTVISSTTWPRFNQAGLAVIVVTGSLHNKQTSHFKVICMQVLQSFLQETAAQSTTLALLPKEPSSENTQGRRCFYVTEGTLLKSLPSIT